MSHAFVVDDEPHILRVVELALRQIGCEVSMFANGQQAWKTMQLLRPDLLITDLQMPIMDGFELVRLVRTVPEFSEIPILLLTAKCHELSTSETQALDSCVVVGKPFSPNALARQVSSTLTSKAGSLGSERQRNLLQ